MITNEEISMRLKVKRLGYSSLGLILPKELMRLNNINVGDVVEVRIRKINNNVIKEAMRNE